MLLGARQFFERRGTPTPPIPDVDSYAGFSEAWSFWDGIRNVGISSPHDNASRTWCDLARNDATFALNDAWSFSDIGLQTTSDTGIMFGGVNEDNYFAGANDLGEMTYECVFDYGSFREQSGNNFGGRLGFEIENLGMIFYGEPWSVRYYLWAYGQGNYSYNASSDIATGFMSVVGVWSASQGFVKLYINNVLKKTTAVTSAWKFNGQPAHKARFNRSYSSVCGLTGTYHRIQIVKRALTEEELSANFEIDKARFNLS